MNAQLQILKPEIKHFSSQRLKAPNGMELSFVYVTQELAAYWLSNNKCNRRLRADVVNAYSRDMESGSWEGIPSAVALMPDGALGNAQHTLNAIVKSGKPQWLLVAWNTPMRSIAAMDRGIVRTVTDVGHFLGVEIESRRASIARVCNHGSASKGRMSFDELWSAYERHKEAVDFAFTLGPAKRDPGVNSTMLGVVARAWYSGEHDRLVQFVEIVKSGMNETSADQAAIRFRDWARGKTSNSGGGVGVRETYRRSQSAIKHFLAGAPIVKLYGVDGDIFPIPE